jgi:glucose/arabinose dehydrogenase
VIRILSLAAVAAALFGAWVAAPAPSADRDGPGRDVYARYCAGCHGRDLEGGSASSLADGVWTAGARDEDLVATIRRGRPGTAMAGFDGLLSEAEIWRLVVMIRHEEAAARTRPQTVVDPDGAVVASRRQSFRIEVVAKDLNTPWGIAFLPDGRMLVSERPGRLTLFEPGSRRGTVVAGTPEPWTTQDGGFFDVEVHPDHARNGWVYLAYSAKGPEKTSMTRIVRARVRDGRWVDEQALYEPAPELFNPENVHYGSRFLFDPAGKLLYSIGDRGVPGAAQDLASPIGKVHRVNDDGTAAPDNPFVGRAGALATVFTYGHRNPQGFSFDPATGALWEAEHGPMGGDELNVLDPGRNYGWPVVSHGLEKGIDRTAADGMEGPIVYWTPSIAPSAIHFYTGARYPGWKGSLFVTGLGGTALRRLEVSGRTVAAEEVLFDRYGRVRDVVTGPDGLLYVALQLPGRYPFTPTPGLVVRLWPVP